MRLTKISLPKRGGIDSGEMNLFRNQVLLNFRYLFGAAKQSSESITEHLWRALVGTPEGKEVIIKKLERNDSSDDFFYESLNTIYNRCYNLEQKTKELLRSL